MNGVYFCLDIYCLSVVLLLFRKAVRDVVQGVKNLMTAQDHLPTHDTNKTPSKDPAAASRDHFSPKRQKSGGRGRLLIYRPEKPTDQSSKDHKTPDNAIIAKALQASGNPNAHQSTPNLERIASRS